MFEKLKVVLRSYFWDCVVIGERTNYIDWECGEFKIGSLWLLIGLERNLSFEILIRVSLWVLFIDFCENAFYNVLVLNRFKFLRFQISRMTKFILWVIDCTQIIRIGSLILT